MRPGCFLRNRAEFPTPILREICNKRLTEITPSMPMYIGRFIPRYLTLLIQARIFAESKQIWLTMYVAKEPFAWSTWSIAASARIG